MAKKVQWVNESGFSGLGVPVGPETDWLVLLGLGSTIFVLNMVVIPTALLLCGQDTSLGGLVI